MTKFPWTNRETRLWLIQDEQPEYLHCVGLRSLEIMLDKSASNWTCSHCGSYIENETSCSHCNAPKSSRRRVATAEIYGQLPPAKVLDELKDSFSFEVLRACYGRPDDYRNEYVILQLSDCKTTRKWINDLVILAFDDAGPVELNLRVNCNAALFFPEDV